MRLRSRRGSTCWATVGNISVIIMTAAMPGAWIGNNARLLTIGNDQRRFVANIELTAADRA